MMSIGGINASPYVFFRFHINTMAVDCCLLPHVSKILPGAVSDSTMVGMGKTGIKYKVGSQRQSFLE